jgi:hypothetical protein
MLLQFLHNDAGLLPFLYEKCSASTETTLQSLPALKDYVQTVLNGADKTLIVIDGMDECDDAERKAMLAFLLPAIDAVNDGRPGAVRALFTSQDVADMRSRLRKAAVVTLNTQDSMQDIRSFTVHWAAKIQNMFELPTDEVRRITDHVIDTASGESLYLSRCPCFSRERCLQSLGLGMFLYAKLVMQNLHDCATREELYEEIHPDTLPKGIDQA